VPASPAPAMTVPTLGLVPKRSREPRPARGLRSVVRRNRAQWTLIEVAVAGSTNSIRKSRFRPTIHENRAMANVDAASLRRKYPMGALKSQLPPKHRLSQECPKHSKCLPAVRAAPPKICLWSAMGIPPGNACARRDCKDGDCDAESRGRDVHD
jgi:hypothetical protein